MSKSAQVLPFAASRTTASGHDVAPVRVLDVDRDLAEALDDHELEEASRALVAPAITLGKGDWSPRQARPRENAHVGVLVTDGILCREVAIGDSICAELVGPGDLLRPWVGPGDSLLVSCDVRWHVLEDAQLAMLGQRFAAVAARWPALTSALVGRAISRSHALALSATISCTTGLETRLSMLFWHMAARWGKVRPDGVVVPIAMTHELIGRLIGARRPSVSTALKQLDRGGVIKRLHGGGWLLAGDPPQAVTRHQETCADTAAHGTPEPLSTEPLGGRQLSVELPFQAPGMTGGERRRARERQHRAPAPTTQKSGRRLQVAKAGRPHQAETPSLCD